MNEKKAKKLRKLIFGDYSYKSPREYMAVFFDKKARDIELPGGVVLRYIPFTVFLKPGTRHATYRTFKRALKLAI